jgi:hypothetical protein
MVDNSDRLMQDPVNLFYSLYFSLYFNNESMYRFLASLINKMGLNSHPSLKVILHYISEYGIERLRSVKESVNQVLYHFVLYRAFD